MVRNVEKLWGHSEYHTAVDWCENTGKEQGECDLLSKSAAE